MISAVTYRTQFHLVGNFCFTSLLILSQFLVGCTKIEWIPTQTIRLGLMSKPPFVSLLSDEDILAYKKLRESFCAANQRYRRNQRMQLFTDSLLRIKRFCHKGDADDWKRCLVCGICWVNDNVLALNNQRLNWFMGKSKSTINDVLTKLRFKYIPINRENGHTVTEKIPYLEKHPEELRQWSLRHTRDPGVFPVDEIDDLFRLVEMDDL